MSRFWIIIFILTVVSCRKNIEPTEPYLKFDIVGEQLLSGIKLNDSIKFAGSNGSNREYRVFNIETGKQSVQDCSWNTGSCVTYYYFDFLKIYFTRTDTIPPPGNSPLTSSIGKQMQLPPGINKENIPKDVQAKVHVHGGLVDFNAIPSSGMGVLLSPYITYPDFYQPISYTTYSNAIRTYTEVVIIKSGNNSVYIDPINGKRYTVNEVWFDIKHGIVFFKDVFGNTWSRTT